MSEMWWQGTLVGDYSSLWDAVSLVVGASLIALGLTMRPEGKKIAWGWANGYAENSTPVGKVVFFVGLGLAIFGMLTLLSALIDGLLGV